MNWIKLTPAHSAAIAALTATNPTSHFVTPVLDTHGDAWLTADVLTETRGVFAHYGDILSALTPTDETPVFPAEETES